MALSVSSTCCALVRASAVCCGYLCYPSAVKRLWPLWSNPVPLSLIRCTCVVPSFLGCCIIRHMVLIALSVGRSCDSHWDLITCIIGYLNSDLTEAAIGFYHISPPALDWPLVTGQRHQFPCAHFNEVVVLLLWCHKPFFVVSSF